MNLKCNLKWWHSQFKVLQQISVTAKIETKIIDLPYRPPQGNMNHVLFLASSPVHPIDVGLYLLSKIYHFSQFLGLAMAISTCETFLLQTFLLGKNHLTLSSNFALREDFNDSHKVLSPVYSVLYSQILYFSFKARLVIVWFRDCAAYTHIYIHIYKQHTWTYTHIFLSRLVLWGHRSCFFEHHWSP